MNCPKCGVENKVPEESPGLLPAEAAPTSQPTVATGILGAAAAAAAAAEDAATPGPLAFDDIPNLIAERPQIITSPPAASPPESVDATASSALPPAPPPAPPGWAAATAPADDISLSMRTTSRATNVAARLKHRPEDALLMLTRRAVYAMAGLIFSVAVLAFAAGYLIGRGPGGGKANGLEQSEDNEPVDPVSLEGSLIYSASPGQYEPDADAIVLALPSDKKPAEKLSLSAKTLSANGGVDAAATAVRGLGGALVRANGDGEFQLVVPRPGQYFLLFVSQHVKRPAGKTVDSAALNELAAYLANPSELIGSHKYMWKLEHLSGAPAPISRDFGADGK